jgi:tetratricopeptide (TPR) repeat protein
MRIEMHKYLLIALVPTAFLLARSDVAAAETALVRLVKKIQPAVATVIAYDLDRNISNIGTGFFINAQGDLITNFHVLAGTYQADVRTATGRSYRVKAVLAENKAADLLKLRVDIPPAELAWIAMGGRPPEIGERVVVVGSPMGLEQTVSEGIVSSVRELPPVGTVFQISAPISPGSSGSPVVNSKGEVVGIATFQLLQGQNLNFAVAARQIMGMRKFGDSKSVSEWTFEHLGNKPRVAQALCEKGFSFSINGEDQQAFQFFKKATEDDPGDSAAWSGLGSCYAGLNHAEEAIGAYRQAIAANPRDEASHFHLANYFGRLGRFDEAIAAYQEAIALNPNFEAAHFNLGVVYARIGRYEEGRQAFETVVRLDPDALPAYFNAGIALSQLGRYEEAVNAQRNAIRLNSDFAPAHHALGEALAKLGREKEELAAYREAIRVDPDFAPAHYALGASMLKKGDRSGALEQFKILKKLDSNLADTLFTRIYPQDEPAQKPKRASKQPQP